MERRNEYGDMELRSSSRTTLCAAPQYDTDCEFIPGNVLFDRLGKKTDDVWFPGYRFGVGECKVQRRDLLLIFAGFGIMLWNAMNVPEKQGIRYPSQVTTKQRADSR